MFEVDRVLLEVQLVVELGDEIRTAISLSRTDPPSLS